MPDLKEICGRTWKQALQVVGVKQELKPPYIRTFTESDPGYEDLMEQLDIKRSKDDTTSIEFNEQEQLFSLELTEMPVSCFDKHKVIANNGIIVYPAALESEFLEQAVLHEAIRSTLMLTKPKVHYLMHHRRLGDMAQTNYLMTHDMLVTGLEAKAVGAEQVNKKILERRKAAGQEGIFDFDFVYRALRAVEGVDVAQSPETAYIRLTLEQIKHDGMMPMTPEDLGINPYIDSKTLPYDKFFRRTLDGEWEETK